MPPPLPPAGEGTVSGSGGAAGRGVGEAGGGGSYIHGVIGQRPRGRRDPVGRRDRSRPFKQRSGPVLSSEYLLSDIEAWEARAADYRGEWGGGSRHQEEGEWGEEEGVK